MNIKEAKDVLARVNAEYLVYCDSGNKVDWFESGKSAGEILGMIANVDGAAKAFAFQKGTSVYEAVYAQVFEAEKIVLLRARRAVVDNVAKFYLIPLGKTVKIEDVLPRVEVVPNGKGMKGMGGMARTSGRES